MEKNAFRTEISLLNLQNHVCNIFQLHKTPLKIKKKKILPRVLNSWLTVP
jgi:hypothetical protein